MDNKLICDQLVNLNADERIKDLSKLVSKKNLFSLLNIHRDELVHSDLLANLLKGDNFDNLGNIFLKEFLIFISSKANLDKTQIFEALDTFYEIKREYHKIDIIIFFPYKKWIIIIENKIEHYERFNQLKDYQNFIENQFPDYDKKIFIFLTKDGRESRTFDPSFEDHINISLSYPDVGNLISLIIPKLDSGLKKNICEEFMEHIDSDLSNNIEELSFKLYKSYPLAVDYLLKNSIPYIEKFEKILEEISKKHHLKSYWDYPPKSYGKTQISYLKDIWNEKLEIIFFISQNPNFLYNLFIIPAIHKKIKNSLDPNLKIEFYPVPECIKDWSYYSIETKAILISESPLKDFNVDLENKIDLGLKSAVAIADEYFNKIKK